MAYALGAVKPWVQGFAEYIGAKHSISTIYGWRASSVDMSGHPSGRALDLVVGNDKAKGDAVAATCVQLGAGALIKYVIWQQAIYTIDAPDKGWVAMATRSTADGSDANHLRHVHLSFTTAVDDGRTFTEARQGSASMGKIPETGGGLGAQLGDVAEGVFGLSPLGVLTGAGTDLDPMDAIGNAASALTDPNTWIRVAQVVGGVVAILVGVALLSKDIAAPVAGVAMKVAPQGKAVSAALGAVGAGKK